MGWSNYIILPKHKIMFEVSRETEGDTDYDDLFMLNEDDYNFVDENKKLQDLTLKDLNGFYEMQKACMDIRKEEVLFYLLKRYDDKTFIISEYDLSERKEEFKDYVRVMRP